MTRNAFAEYEELCKQTREQAALKQRLIRNAADGTLEDLRVPRAA